METQETYLLDTCICIALIKRMPSVVDRIRLVGVDNCKISVVTLAELILARSSLA
ncbi:MAG: hypothetical protein IJQ83_05595 [Bacteroidales bacterium]|nr:hypothetical protein [Bacteroidales bacterium]